MFETEQISPPEFERKVQALSLASHSDALQLVNGYRSFVNIWHKLDNSEKRNILSTMFDSLFFDREGRLVRAVAYEPFRELLSLPEDGMIAELLT